MLNEGPFCDATGPLINPNWPHIHNISQNSKDLRSLIKLQAYNLQLYPKKVKLSLSPSKNIFLFFQW